MKVSDYTLLFKYGKYEENHVLCLEEMLTPDITIFFADQVVGLISKSPPYFKLFQRKNKELIPALTNIEGIALLPPKFHNSMRIIHGYYTRPMTKSDFTLIESNWDLDP